MRSFFLLTSLFFLACFPVSAQDFGINAGFTFLRPQAIGASHPSVLDNPSALRTGINIGASFIFEGAYNFPEVSYMSIQTELFLPRNDSGTVNETINPQRVGARVSSRAYKLKICYPLDINSEELMAFYGFGLGFGTVSTKLTVPATSIYTFTGTEKEQTYKRTGMLVDVLVGGAYSLEPVRIFANAGYAFNFGGADEGRYAYLGGSYVTVGAIYFLSDL